MIKCVNHIGMSVTNMERSIEFYRKAFGAEVMIESTFEKGSYGGKYSQILGLQGATGKVAALKAGEVSLELFEFAHPIPNRIDPRYPVSDHGISHFCIEVTDIHSEYERLKALGVYFHCPPLDFGKAIATYARDPDGNVFEMLELVAAPKAT